MNDVTDGTGEAELPDLLVDPAERNRWLRFVEALLFASADPLDESELRRRVPEEIDVKGLLADLAEHYADLGVVLKRSGTRWAFRTAIDLGPMLRHERPQRRKLSRAAIETLAIIAYHQPTTRAEIEEIRGVALSKGTIDTLLEAGWIAPRGRRETPGRPLQWGTTNAFLDHFGLESLKELPGVEELRAAGLLDRRSGATSIAMQQDDLEDDPEEDEDIQLDFLPDTNDPDEGDQA
jgi:segregation and condensation protein B